MGGTSETTTDSGKETRDVKKWAIAGMLAAGIVLTGITFGVMQGRATAGSGGTIAPVTPEGVVETTGQQPGPRQYARRGGCGSGCGQSVRRSCCGGPPTTAGQGAQQETFQMDPTVPPEGYGAYLADYYTKKLGQLVEVEVRDFGCHQEAQVTREGRLIKRLSISSGYVTEIG